MPCVAFVPFFFPVFSQARMLQTLVDFCPYVMYHECGQSKQPLISAGMMELVDMRDLGAVTTVKDFISLHPLLTMPIAS